MTYQALAAGCSRQKQGIKLLEEMKVTAWSNCLKVIDSPLSLYKWESLTLSLPRSKSSTFSQPSQIEMYKWCNENLEVQSCFIWVSLKRQVLHTVWCNISGEAAGEIWTWSLLGVKGLSPGQTVPQLHRSCELGLSWEYLLARTLDKGRKDTSLRRYFVVLFRNRAIMSWKDMLVPELVMPFFHFVATLFQSMLAYCCFNSLNQMSK